MPERVDEFPIGAAVSDARLESDLHAVFAELRQSEPVSWVPALDAWVVTSRASAIAVMRDPDLFTVDDPRFSTGQVLGPSMLSRDGLEHARHRHPFAAAFRLGEVQERLTERVGELASELVAELAPAGRAELRRDLAGPLAVQVMAAALELVDGEPDMLLTWYDEIVAAVTATSTGDVSGTRHVPAAVGDLVASVGRTIDTGGGVLAAATSTLTTSEVVSNTGVMLFGGIETSEGMTANLFAHLLGAPEWWSAIDADRRLIADAVDESLRLEPSVVRVDRFATRPATLGKASIGSGDFVIVALSAANRDPAHFPDPDRFDPRRPNAKQHLTFAQGPHVCLGMHLARAEARAAVVAALDHLPRLRLDPARPVPEPAGTVFRKPPRVDVVWDADR